MGLSVQAKQAIAMSLDTLSNELIGAYMGKKESELQTQQQLVASLFQNQLGIEQQYRADLKEKGITLPEEYRSNNYLSIVENAGDQPLLDTLNQLYAESSSNIMVLEDAQASFRKGAELASQYSSDVDIGFSTPGEVGIEAFRYGPEETEEAFAAFDIMGIDTSAAGFKAGFSSYSNEEKAKLRYDTDKQNRATDLQLFNAEIESATRTNHTATLNVGNEILSSISSIPGLQNVGNVKGWLASPDEDTQSLGNDEYQKIFTHIQNNYPLIAQDLSNAISKYVTTAGADGMLTPYDGFRELAADAYKTAQLYMQTGANKSSPHYDKFSQYVPAGIIPGDPDNPSGFDMRLLEQGYTSDAYNDKILNVMQTWNSNNISNLLEEGFGYNAVMDSLEFIDKNSDRFIDVNDTANQVYQSLLEEQQPDMLADYQLDPEVLGYDVNTLDQKVGELATTEKDLKAKSGEAYRLLQDVDLFGDEILGLGATRPGSEMMRYSDMELFPEWDQLVAQTMLTVEGLVPGLGIEREGGLDPLTYGQAAGEMYIPSDSDIENMKKIFIKTTQVAIDPDVTDPKVRTFLRTMNTVIPGVSQISYPQGRLGAAQHRLLHRTRLNAFNKYLEKINEIRKLQGKKEVQLIDLGL